MKTWSEEDVKLRLERFSIPESKVSSLVSEAVDVYIEEHGIKTGATDEQAEMIEESANRIETLEESVEEYNDRIAELEEKVQAAPISSIDDILNS